MPSDAHDRAAADTKKKKVVVKKKKRELSDAHDRAEKVAAKKKSPPLPVPSLEAAYTPTPPKPKPVVIKTKPTRPTLMDRKRGRHLPQEFEYLAPEDFALPVGRKRGTSGRAIEKFNQAKERERREQARAERAAEKAAREARRAEVRKARRDGWLPQGLYKGQEPKDYIEHGPRDPGVDLGDIAGALARGAASWAADEVSDFTTQLSGGLSGRTAGKRRSKEYDEQIILKAAEEGIIGHDLPKAIRGEDFNMGWAIADAAMLFVPIKGLPTPMTAALRGLVGASRFARLTREGATVADAVRGAKFMEPLLTQRAARRVALRAKAAATGAEQPLASSWLAGKLAGGRMDPVSKFIRNDPRAKRVYTMGEPGSKVEQTMPADLSRTFKFFVRPALDRLRKIPVVGRAGRIATLGAYKSEEALFLKALAEDARLKSVRHDAQIHKLTKSAKNVPDVGFYAARAVLKNIPIEKMIETTRANMVAARDAGRWLEARALQDHLLYFESAAKYVMRDAVGNVVFRPDAPEAFHTLVREVGSTVATRERIAKQLDELSDQRADLRVLNEQLLYHGAKLQEPDDFVRKAFRAHPIRNAINDLLMKNRSPEERDFTMTLIEALARRHYEEARAFKLARAKELRAEGRALTAVRLEDEAHQLDPAAFFDNIKAVSENIPQEIADEVAQRYSHLYPQIDRFHEFSTARTDKHLADKLENPDKGAVGNARVSGDLNGKRIVLFGPVTYAQWVKRTLVAMPDPDEIERWAAWYTEFEPMFRAVFGDDADALMRGFAVSQANTSPADGLQSVFKVMSDLMNGVRIEREMVQAVDKETGALKFTSLGKPQMVPKTFAVYPDGSRVPKGYSSVVAHNISIAIEKGEINQGLGAKLSDFIDSLIGSETRTWMGHDAKGGMPVAVDVHAARDRGYVDKKLVDRLKERGLVEGVDFVVDNPAGSPSGHIYERTAEWYEGLTKHLNDIEFNGRSDWIPSQVQAVGWAAIQKVHGADPQDFVKALDRNTFTLAFEVSDDLTVAGAHEFGKRMEPVLRRMVEEAGLYWRDIEYSASLWEGATNGSIHLAVVGARENVLPLVNRIAQAFDQGLVQATREITRAGARASLTVSSRAFDDLATRMAFSERLSQVVERLAGSGSMPDTLNGRSAFTVITDRGYLSPEEQPWWLSLFKQGIEQVEKEMGLDDVEFGAKNIELLIGDQVGEGSFDTATSGARRLGLDDLDPDTAEVRRSLQAAVRELYASVDEDVQAQVARLAAIDARVDPALKEMVEREYQTNRDAYDLSAGFTRGGRGPARAVPKDVELPRMAGGRVDIQRAGELARPVERTGREYLGPSQSGRELAEAAVLRTLRASDDPTAKEFMRLSDEAEELRSAIARSEEPGWMASAERKRLLGVWDNENKAYYVSPEAHPATYVHELVHAMQGNGLFSEKTSEVLMQAVGATKGQPLTAQQSEDMVDIVLAGFLGIDPKTTKLPAPLKAAFEEMGAAMRQDMKSGYKRANEALKTLPDEVRMQVEDAFWFANTMKSRRFLGAEGMQRGPRESVYTAEVPGLPFSFLSPKRVSVLWGRLRRGQKITRLTPTDEHLTNQFRGYLIESGKWDKSVIKGPLEGLLKASEMERMATIREALYPAAKDIPENPDDIVLLLDPKGWTPETKAQVHAALDLFNEMNPNRPITEQQLYKVDARGIDEAKFSLFPNLDGGGAQADVWGELAATVMQAQKPVPGVKWVNRSALNKLGIAGSPRVKVGESVWGNRALSSFDFFNNYAKLMTLSLNPAYYPMNMAGQGVMMGVQQGAFAPWQLARSMTLAHDLGDAVNLVDIYSGAGLASVVRGRGYAAGFTDAVGEVTRFMIDKYPRRAAFLHEARRLGYKTNAEVLDLLENPGNVDDLMTIAQRANQAMVDFGHLSRIEREWLTRVIFVYPWLKGSTKWTGQFVADHPFMTALFAGLLWWQQDRLHSALPEGRPGYMKWFFPIQIPEDENPYGFRMEQLFTPLQPLDLAADAAYWFGLDTPWGSNEEGIASKLSPLLEEIAKTIMGYDPFTKEQVDHGLLNLLRRMAPDERWASMKRIMKIVHRQEHTGIYDTNQFQNWLRFVFGGLAPIDISREKAGEMAAPERTITVPDKSPELRLREKIEEAEKLGGPIPPEKRAEVEEMFLAGQAYQEAESEYKRENDIQAGLTPQRRLAVLILTYIKLHPEAEETMRPKMEQVLELSDEEAEAEIEIGREKLGLTRLGRIENKLSDLRREAEEAARE